MTLREERLLCLGKKMMRGGYKHNKKERNWMLQKNKTQRYVEIKCQLDATEVFIADLIACSTYFGAPLCPSSGAQKY